jgi:eukaryotic-like serine/threonine-protein kinase
VRTRAADMLAAARATGDHYAEVTAAVYAAFGTLAADRPEDARALVRQAVERWSHAGFHIQHLYAVQLEAYCDLYEHRPERAWERVEAAWPDVERSGLLRVPVTRVDAHALSARCALASRAATICARAAARLAGEERADAKAHALLLHAGLAASAGDEAAAARLAEEAAAAYRRAGMLLHALCADRRRAELAYPTGDVEAIDARIRACGVVDPARWVEIYAPGFRRAAAAA